MTAIDIPQSLRRVRIMGSMFNEASRCCRSRHAQYRAGVTEGPRANTGVASQTLRLSQQRHGIRDWEAFQRTVDCFLSRFLHFNNSNSFGAFADLKLPTAHLRQRRYLAIMKASEHHATTAITLDPRRHIKKNTRTSKR